MKKGIKRKPQPGDIYFDKISDVKVMAFVDNYVMARRKRCIPFVKHIRDFNEEYIFKSCC